MSNQVTTQQPKPPTALEVFSKQIEARRGEFRKLLSSDKAVERFERTLLTTVALNPSLLETDRASLIGSIMKSAEDNLSCDNREAMLNVYNCKVKGVDGKEQWVKKAQYVPMVRGLMKKMRDGGAVSIIASVVRHKDLFKYVKGDEERIVHEPFLDGPAGEVIFAYAIVKMDNGEVIREVMNRQDIDRVRSCSKAKDNGPWKDWFDEMARKTVLRRLSKYLPNSRELEKMLEHDDENFDLSNETSELPATKTDAIKNQLRLNAPRVEEPVAAEPVDDGLPVEDGEQPQQAEGGK